MLHHQVKFNFNLPFHSDNKRDETVSGKVIKIIFEIHRCSYVDDKFEMLVTDLRCL